MHPRYHVLFLFAWLGTQQCYCWYTFASLPDALGDIGVNADEAKSFADMTFNWGPIGFLCAIGPAGWSLRANGLRCQNIICTVLTGGCCVLRCLPLLVAKQDRASLLWLVHA